MLYYLICFGCLLIMVARPAWIVPAAAVESPLTMVALILSTATRVMNPEPAAGALTIEQLVNFLVSGVAASLPWTRSIMVMHGHR